MNIIVCAKQVIDVSEMKVDSSTKKPILQGVSQKISDIDKNAMEEAIKIKEKHGGKITVITIGPADAKERIKELLAMGADEGVLVTAADNIDYFMTAILLAEAIKKIGEYEDQIDDENDPSRYYGQAVSFEFDPHHVPLGEALLSPFFLCLCRYLLRANRLSKLCYLHLFLPSHSQSNSTRGSTHARQMSARRFPTKRSPHWKKRIVPARYMSCV